MGPTSSDPRVSYTGPLPKSALRPNKQVSGALITVVFPALWQREYTGKMDEGRVQTSHIPTWKKKSQAQRLFRSKPSTQTIALVCWAETGLLESSFQCILEDFIIPFPLAIYSLVKALSLSHCLAVELLRKQGFCDGWECISLLNNFQPVLIKCVRIGSLRDN